MAQRRRQKAATVRRLHWAVWGSLAASLTLSACGAAAHREGASLPSRSREAWAATIERAARDGDDATLLAAAAAAAARRAGPLAARSLALEAAAARRRGLVARANAAGDALCDASRTDDRDLTHLDTLLAWLAATPTGGGEVLRLLRQRLDGGCVGLTACDLGARALARLTFDVAPWVAVAEAIAPEDASARQRFWAELARAVADQHRFEHHAALVALSRRANPHSAEAFAAWLYGSARQRGGAQRAAWSRAIASEGLPLATLRVIARHPDVSADHLAVLEALQAAARSEGALEEDWVAWVSALATLPARGDGESARDALRAIASRDGARFATTAGRLALAEALLMARAPADAAPLLAALRTDATAAPRALCLDAERLRVLGDEAGARGLALKVLADHPEHIPWLIARWRSEWPSEAAALDARLPRRHLGLEALRDRGRDALRGFRPGDAALDDLLGLVRALDDALDRAGAPGAPGVPSSAGALLSERRLLAERVATVGQRGTWQGVANQVLVALCDGHHAGAADCAAAAQAFYRARKPERGLAAWLRAQLLAGAQSARLDTEAMARTLAALGDPDALARWLHAAGVQQVADGALAWRIAMVLAAGSAPGLARTWLERALLRHTGRDVLLEPLPGLRERLPDPRVRAEIRDADLEELVRRGFAAQLLENLDALRRIAPGSNALELDLRFGRLEALARATLGQGARARQLIQGMLTRAGSDEAQRRALLELAWSLNLCDVTLQLATEQCRSTDWNVARLALERGLACASATARGDELLALLASFREAQVRRDRHLYVAQRLSQLGLATLAAEWYLRLLGDTQVSTAPDQLLQWADALLQLKRDGEADAVLARALPPGGAPLVLVARQAAKLLMQFERPAAAAALLDRALRTADHIELRLLRLQANLRSGNSETLAEDLNAVTRHGADGATLQRLRDAAQTPSALRLLADALEQVVDGDRELERFRVRIAGLVHDRGAMEVALRRLRAKDSSPSADAVAALSASGAWKAARALGAELLGQGAGSGGDLDAALAAAMQVRRDGRATDEALALARQAVAASLQPQVAARGAASLLADAHFATEAAALAAYAVDGADDAPAICVAGHYAFQAGRFDEADALWRRAAAATLTTPSRPARSATAKELDAGVRCLIIVVGNAGRLEQLGRWLALWLDVQPEVPALWAHAITVQVRLGNTEAALALVAKAETALRTWPQQTLRAPLQELLQAGGGPALAQRWAREVALLRGEPWWRAFVLDVLDDHGAGLGKDAQQRAVDALTRTTASLALGRLHLARRHAARGEAAAAVALLGDAPFALVRVRSLGDELAREVATAAAATLIALAHAAVVRVDAGERVVEMVTGEPEGAWERLEPTVRGWLRVAATREDGIRFAEQLALQGHPRLAHRVLATLPAPSPFTLPIDQAQRALRVVVAAGSDRELDAALDRAVQAPTAGGQAYDRAARRAELARKVARQGRVAAAQRLLAAGAGGDGTGVLASPEDGPAPARIAALRRFELAALDAELAGASDAWPTARAAFVVAVAAGRDGDALTLARRALAQHDEPWHLRGVLVQEATRWRRLEVAQALLAERDVAAPAQAAACHALRIGAEVDVAACVRGRRLTALGVEDLGAVAARALNDAGVAAALLEAFVAAGDTSASRQLLFALAEVARVAPGDARQRATALAAALVERQPTTAQRSRLVVGAMDELSALGLASQAAAFTALALAAQPGDYGAMNNHAYQQLLADAPLSEVRQLAQRSLRAIGGHNAHALLDTLAAVAAKEGHLEQALRFQRAATATDRSGGAPSLPLARLAELLLAASQRHGVTAAPLRDEARLAAAVVLDAADPTDLGTLQRARDVLMTLLRSQEAAPAPLSPTATPR